MHHLFILLVCYDDFSAFSFIDYYTRAQFVNFQPNRRSGLATLPVPSVEAVPTSPHISLNFPPNFNTRIVCNIYIYISKLTHTC